MSSVIQDVAFNSFHEVRWYEIRFQVDEGLNRSEGQSVEA